MHTLGPWRVNPLFYTDVKILGPSDEAVVSLGDDGACGDPDCCGSPTFHVEISDDNARLIIAAPDLLAVLRSYMEMFPAFRAKPVGAPESEMRAREDKLIVMEDAALAKATGV